MDRGDRRPRCAEKQVSTIRNRHEHDQEDRHSGVEQVETFHAGTLRIVRVAVHCSAATKPTALSQTMYGMTMPRRRRSVPTLPFVRAIAAAVGIMYPASTIVTKRSRRHPATSPTGRRATITYHNTCSGKYRSSRDDAKSHGLGTVMKLAADRRT